MTSGITIRSRLDFALPRGQSPGEGGEDQGDRALHDHSDDPRGRPYVGKRVRLPIANLEIPVLADDSVDRAFGTGFVKVTPAHDASDFEIGTRHGLDMPLVMTPDGRMGGPGTEQRVPAELQGVDRFDSVPRQDRRARFEVCAMQCRRREHLLPIRIGGLGQPACVAGGLLAQRTRTAARDQKR